MQHPTLYAGVDVGGTKTLMVLAEQDGTILSEWRVASDAQTDPETFFGGILDELRREVAKLGRDVSALQGIGFGLPGVIGPAGILTHAPAFPWQETPVADILKQLFDGAVYLDNDVNVAALGEQWQGAAQGVRDFLMVTVGTGIGGALYLDGRIYRGAGAAAGEIGYSVIAPPPTLLPQNGTAPEAAAANGDVFGQFEQIASGTGIGRLAREHLARSERSAAASLIAQLAGGAPEAVNARHVLAAAAQGDAEALELLRLPLDYMAIGIANAVSLLNPAMVVIGGGVADSGELYVAAVRERIAALTPIATKVVAARLGNRAGAVGALAGVIPNRS